MSAINEDFFPLFEAHSQMCSPILSSEEEIAESPCRIDEKIPEPINVETAEKTEKAGRKIILLSSERVLPHLEEKLKKHKAEAKAELCPAHWIRDSRVVLPNGSYLLPAEFLTDEISWAILFCSLLPKEMLHFASEARPFVARGPSPEYRKNAINAAEKWNIEYKQGSTCIEGGNCHIFLAEDGKPKAIVGYNSVLISLVRFIACEQFGTVEELLKNSPALKNYGEDPDRPPLNDDALRIGRNVYYYLKNEAITDIYEPFSHPGRPKWIAMARNIQNLIFLTKEKIAKELDVPLDRVAFVFQERFHTDTELFVGPRDTVFLQDESLTRKITEQFKPSFGKTPFLLRALNYSKSHEEINQNILSHNISVLEQIGCKAVRVPGVLTAMFKKGEVFRRCEFLHNWTKNKCNAFPLNGEGSDVLDHPEFPNMLNFMNGIYLGGPTPLFITNGASKGDPVTEAYFKGFKETIREACPEIKICPLRKGDLTKRLPIDDGALRCKTSFF